MALFKVLRNSGNDLFRALENSGQWLCDQGLNPGCPPSVDCDDVGRFQGFYTDENGKKKYFTGSTSRRETLAIAHKLESNCRQVRLGCREPRQTHFKHRDCPFAEVVTEYLEWGKVQGGHVACEPTNFVA